MGVQPFEFVPPHPFSPIPISGICASCCPPTAIPGAQWVAAPPTALSRGISCYSNSCPQPFMQYWSTQFLGLSRVTLFPHLPYMAKRGIFFRCGSTWQHIWLNMWWALSLVILVWWLCSRFMNLPSPGQWNILMFDHRFFPGSWERCQF